MPSSNRRASVGGKMNDKDIAKYLADRNNNLNPRAMKALDNDSSNDAYDCDKTPSPRPGMLGQYPMKSHEEEDQAPRLPMHTLSLPTPKRMYTLSQVAETRSKSLSVNWLSEDTLVKPMRLTSFMVDHPFLIHFFVLALSIVLTIINPNDHLLSDLGAISAILPDYAYFTDGYHANIAIKNRLKGERTAGHPQSGSDMTMILMFEQMGCDLEEDPDCDIKESPWIFTPSNLATIMKYEDMILNHPKWQHLCHHPLEVGNFSLEADALATCGSAVGGFAGPLVDMLGGDVTKTTTASIKATMAMILTFMPSLGALFDPSIMDHVDMANPQYLTAKRYRSTFGFGLPYPTNVEAIMGDVETVVNNATVTENIQIGWKKSSSYSNCFDDAREQRFDYFYKNFVWDLVHDIDYKPKGNKRDGHLLVSTYGDSIWGDFFQFFNVQKIVPLYILAATITLFYATYDIGSFFLSFMALWEVAVTLPYTWFWYNMVFGINEFVHIQLAVIFVLFAVGVYYYPAYVFVDHWLSTVHVVSDASDFKARLSIAWKQAASGAGVAQSTTFVSFASAAMGTVLMFKAFGVFAAIAILTNYCLGITLFPCSIIIWEKYVRGWEEKLADWMHSGGLGCCAPRISEGFYKRFKTETDRQMSVSSVTLHNEEEQDRDWFKASLKRLKSGIVDIGFGEQKIDELEEQYRKTGVFVGIRWMHILHRLWVKVLVVFIALCWLSIALWGCSKVKPLEENEDFLGPETFLMKAMNALSTGYGTMYNGIDIAYGVKGLKDKSRSVWQSDSVGVEELTPISVHSAAQQQWLVDYCDLIRGYESTVNPNDTLVRSDGGVNCIIEDFRDWILSDSDVGNATWPFIKEGVSDDTSLEQKEYFLGHFYEWYQISADGLGKRNSYKVDIRFDPDNVEEPYELKAFFSSASSMYEFWSVKPLADKEEANWREFMKHSKAECLEALGDDHGNLCSPRISSLRMAWSEGYVGYWESATGSIYLAFPIIFVILMVVLNNWIIALLCCINVVCIMCSTMGIIGHIGWQFGLTECASVILVIGFSVDYCVHIAHGYIVAPLKDNREHRCQFALLQNGHAIISSAFVSVLSTIPILLDKQMVLFFKMGVLTTLTVTFSVIFSFTVFTLMLATIAPEGNAGKIFGACKSNGKVHPLVDREHKQEGLIQENAETLC